MRGRKPVPTSVKILTGNPGKRPLNGLEPELPAGAGDPPDHLDETARAEWSRVAPMLAAAGVITAGDRAVLALYCVAWSRWVRAEARLAETGDVIRSAAGGEYLSPHLAVSNRAAEQLARLATVLGLDPSSRSRIAAAPAEQPRPKVLTRPKTKLDEAGPPKAG